MKYTLLYAVIALCLNVCSSLYNKDVVCIKDKGHEFICKSIDKPKRRADAVNNELPSHDPYIPRADSIFYNCSSPECKGIELYSLTQVTSPTLELRSCYKQAEKYDCETVRYNYLKNVDKVLFLSSTIRNKTFYMVDCLVYSDGGRVCQKKDASDSYTKLVDTGTIVRPREPNVLSEDEFICEETRQKAVNCDLNPYVPYPDGVKLKETFKPDNKIILKTGTHVIILTRNCIDSWCGYSGSVSVTRRNSRRYEPPGGKVYRCYYAKKQQICKELYGSEQPVYNQRGHLRTQ